MSVLTVTNVPDEVVVRLERRAAAHGITENEELIEILKSALGVEVSRAAGSPKSGEKSKPPTFPTSDDDCPDWLFDRHDLRHGQNLLPTGEDFKAHLLALGEVGPDIRLDWPRTVSEHRTVDL